jgi:predicted dehydrogenase
MTALTAAFVGTGSDPATQTMEGFAMAYRHATAFENAGVELVGCADLVRENAAAFADYWDVPPAHVFESHEELLGTVEPDVVSVCTPPPTHADLVVDCARSGAVDAVHCEKPMARTWANAERMVAVCREEGVQLTFNHQRRFGTPYRTAKALLDAGEIGTLERVEAAAPDIYDYGTHSVDLSNYFADEGRAEWVLAGLDYREERRAFGVHLENQTLATWRYENGVDGLFVGGAGAGLVDCHNRLVGSDGVIEVGRGFPGGDVGDPVLRVVRDGEAPERVDCDGEGLHGPDSGEYGSVFIDRAVADVVDALESGREPELRGENALKATEIVLGAYESARRRGRVEFPLGVSDNPLDAMVESGDLDPDPSEE